MNVVNQAVELGEAQRLLWFTFSQNNSGGSFTVDENVCEYVFVQAKSAKDAVLVAQNFCDNSDSCSCCGDRWSFYVEDNDGTTEPQVYGEPITMLAPSHYRKEARLHYFDGHVETYKFGTDRPLTLK